MVARPLNLVASGKPTNEMVRRLIHLGEQEDCGAGLACHGSMGEQAKASVAVYLAAPWIW